MKTGHSTIVTMRHRNYSLFDSLLIRADKLLTPLRAKKHSVAPHTDKIIDDPTLSPLERRRSVRLLRVDHAGELAAQGLYTGQALVARNHEISELFARLAEEESAHLDWCKNRIQELKGRTSLLGPLWFTGSIIIGGMAGTMGDSKSLGFVIETEKQVGRHLQSHLEKLPVEDLRSRAILEKMQTEEAKHGETAKHMGGVELPLPIRLAMKASSKLMTGIARWI